MRELEAFLLRALTTLSRPERLGASDLSALSPAASAAGGDPDAAPPGSRAATPARRPGGELLCRPLDAWRGELERDYLTALFRELRGDVRAMARRLAVSRTRLYDWCREVGVDIRALRRRL